MVDDEYKALAEFFDGYIGEFIARAQDLHPIVLKKEHTLRVVENIMFLGKELGISRQKMVVAKAAALLHDIGRFKQFETYGTFSDALSKNHAVLGVGVIREHRLLASCPRFEKKQIIRAIALHNRYQLPSGMDRDTLFLTRMLRDTDKLDILNVMVRKYLGADPAENGYMTLDLPDDGQVSGHIAGQVLKKKIIDNRQVRSLNDLKLLQISWVFDLNFKTSVKQMGQLGFIPSIISTMPDSDLMTSLADFINSHMAAQG